MFRVGIFLLLALQLTGFEAGAKVIKVKKNEYLKPNFGELPTDLQRDIEIWPMTNDILHRRKRQTIDYNTSPLTCLFTFLTNPLCRNRNGFNNNANNNYNGFDYNFNYNNGFNTNNNNNNNFGQNSQQPPTHQSFFEQHQKQQQALNSQQSNRYLSYPPAPKNPFTYPPQYPYPNSQSTSTTTTTTTTAKPQIQDQSLYQPSYYPDNLHQSTSNSIILSTTTPSTITTENPNNMGISSTSLPMKILHDENLELRRQYLKLQQEVLGTENQVKELQESNQRLTSVNQIFEQTVRSMQESNQNNEQQFKELQKQNERLQTQNQQFEQTLKALQKSNEDLQTQNEELRQLHTKEKADKERLSRQIELCEERNKNILQRNESTIQELASLQLRTQQLERTNQDLQNLNGQLQHQVQDQKQQLNLLREQNKVKEGQIQRLHQQNLPLHQEIQQIRQEAKDLRDQNQRLDQETRTLKQQIHLLQEVKTQDLNKSPQVRDTPKDIKLQINNAIPASPSQGLVANRLDNSLSTSSTTPASVSIYTIFPTSPITTTDAPSASISTTSLSPLQQTTKNLYDEFGNFIQNPNYVPTTINLDVNPITTGINNPALNPNSNPFNPYNNANANSNTNNQNQQPSNPNPNPNPNTSTLDQQLQQYPPFIWQFPNFPRLFEHRNNQGTGYSQNQVFYRNSHM